MDRLTSPRARHGQTIRELMRVTSPKHMRGLEHITISITGSSIIENSFLMTQSHSASIGKAHEGVKNVRFFNGSTLSTAPEASSYFHILQDRSVIIYSS